ncbi:Uncharacterized protein TCM_029054 [Theobroma cacao]|uniref:Uncharacterized protein n=1 Tax=Theobroma cacao TaxID=3641 RepID=A0A061GC27_THECC|nr:Uncharacterized protein TCM_029054 [Theobroma cacao]
MWPDLATMAPDRCFPAVGSGHGVPDPTVGFSRKAPDPVLPRGQIWGLSAKSGWISVESYRKGLDRRFSTIFDCCHHQHHLRC